ncbi:MAG: prepilin peptidase [Anaerovoracaceae bacterium]
MLTLIYAVSTILGLLGLWVFDRIPQSWLLDYGVTLEEWSGKSLKPPRINLWPEGITIVVLFALASTGVYYLHGGDYRRIGFAIIILWLLMLIVIADIIYGILPDQIIIVIGMTGLVFQIVGSGGYDFQWNLLEEPFLGALVCGGGLFSLSAFTALLSGGETVGMGDCKLLCALGILHGPLDGLWVLLFAILISGLYFAAAVMIGHLKLDSYAPFAPHIALSSSLWLIFG